MWPSIKIDAAVHMIMYFKIGYRSYGGGALLKTLPAA